MNLTTIISVTTSKAKRLLVMFVAVAMLFVYVPAVTVSADEKVADVRITNSNILEIDWTQSGKYYVLDEDINLIIEWKPIENFNGTFDGQGYTINGLYVSSSSKVDFVGLFGYIEKGSNVTIKNVSVYLAAQGITASSSDTAGAGGLIGFSDEYSTVNIQNSCVIGNVSAKSVAVACAGGLVGSSSGTTTITNSYATGNVSASVPASPYFPMAGAGGLVGGLDSGHLIITNCYSTSDVSASASNGYSYAGGLIGIDGYAGNGPTITNSYRLSTQSVTAAQGAKPTVNSLGEILTPERMQVQESFSDWDFHTVWGYKNGLNDNYPILRIFHDDLTQPETLVYEAMINPSSKTFPTAGSVYDNVAMTQEFTIENTGTGQITNLTASILSASYDYTNFEIVTELSATTLTPGETATLSIRPANGLKPYTYADVLTIAGDNGINFLVPLSFTVSDEQVYALTVDPASQTFTAEQAGYSNIDKTQIFTIENTGTEDITGLSASLAGIYFEITSPLSATTITSGSALTISVRPVNDLPANETPYTDTLTVTSDNDINLTVELSFTVSKLPVYSATINPPSKIYPMSLAGYNNVYMTQVFTIENTGTEQITGLLASLNNSYFEICSELSATFVNPSSIVTISARPNNNLPASNTPYKAVLTITSNKGVNFDIPLDFMVYTETSPKNMPYGDLNSDSMINNADLMLMLRYFAQPGINVNLDNADINGDSFVNSADLILFLRYFVQPGIVLGPVW